MANTYSQINIQIVFAVKYRRALIQPTWENELYKYITGIIQAKGQKLLAINGAYNHIHILIGMKPTCCLSDLVREIKKSSTNFVNEKKLCTCKFEWQEGFGAFSYNQQQVSNVITYIQNQKMQHQKQSFKDEYLDLLKKFDISYNEEYVFNNE